MTTDDSKTLAASLLREGRLPAGVVMDTSLAGYLLNPLASDYSLPRLAQEYGVSAPEGGGGDARTRPGGDAAARYGTGA